MSALNAIVINFNYIFLIILTCFMGVFFGLFVCLFYFLFFNDCLQRGFNAFTCVKNLNISFTCACW